MVTILGTVTIEDLPKFLGIFSTRGARMRRLHGSRRAEVYRECESDTAVRVLFEWSSREDFERFLADPEVKAAMAASGTVGRPEFTFLEAVATLPG